MDGNCGELLAGSFACGEDPGPGLAAVGGAVEGGDLIAVLLVVASGEEGGGRERIEGQCVDIPFGGGQHAHPREPRILRAVDDAHPGVGGWCDLPAAHVSCQGGGGVDGGGFEGAEELLGAGEDGAPGEIAVLALEDEPTGRVRHLTCRVDQRPGFRQGIQLLSSRRGVDPRPLFRTRFPAVERRLFPAEGAAHGGVAGRAGTRPHGERVHLAQRPAQGAPEIGEEEVDVTDGAASHTHGIGPAIARVVVPGEGLLPGIEIVVRVEIEIGIDVIGAIRQSGEGVAPAFAVGAGRSYRWG